MTAQFNTLCTSSEMAAFIAANMPADPPVSLAEALMDTLNAWPCSDRERRVYAQAITLATRIADGHRNQALNAFLREQSA